LPAQRCLHIPYRGSPEAIQDTIAGRVAFYMAPINTALGLVNEGRLTALGISTKARADVLPQVAPLAEQGLPSYDVSLWFGMWAPAGTPPAIVQKLNAQVAQSMRNAEVVAQFGKLGISPLPMFTGPIRPLRAQRDHRSTSTLSNKPASLSSRPAPLIRSGCPGRGKRRTAARGAIEKSSRATMQPRSAVEPMFVRGDLRPEPMPKFRIVGQPDRNRNIIVDRTWRSFPQFP